MPTFLNKSNGTDETPILTGHAGVARKPRLTIGNPNTASAEGALYLQDKGVNHFITNWYVDGKVRWEDSPDLDVQPHQQLVVIPDAAPSAALTLIACYD